MVHTLPASCTVVVVSGKYETHMRGHVHFIVIAGIIVVWPVGSEPHIFVSATQARKLLGVQVRPELCPCFFEFCSSGESNGPV